MCDINSTSDQVFWYIKHVHAVTSDMNHISQRSRQVTYYNLDFVLDDKIHTTWSGKSSTIHTSLYCVPYCHYQLHVLKFSNLKTLGLACTNFSILLCSHFSILFYFISILAFVVLYEKQKREPKREPKARIKSENQKQEPKQEPKKRTKARTKRENQSENQKREPKREPKARTKRESYVLESWLHPSMTRSTQHDQAKVQHYTPCPVYFTVTINCTYLKLAI